MFKCERSVGRGGEAYQDDVEVKIADKTVAVSKKRSSEQGGLGDIRFSYKQYDKGVTAGFEKKLIIEGIGFKAMLEGQNFL